MGRLDYDTEGMLILTDDGDLAFRLTHPKNEIPKTYLVRIEGTVGETELNKLRGGVELEMCIRDRLYTAMWGNLPLPKQTARIRALLSTVATSLTPRSVPPYPCLLYTSAIFERSFLVFKNNEPRVRALSRWCLLDSVTGRIAPASAINQKTERFIEERPVDFCDWRIPFVEDKIEPAFTLKIAHAEYDLNYHVNNIKYADYVFNCFSIEEDVYKRQIPCRSSAVF